jgi:hypothetical protein
MIITLSKCTGSQYDEAVLRDTLKAALTSVSEEQQGNLKALDWYSVNADEHLAKRYTRVA